MKSNGGHIKRLMHGGKSLDNLGIVCSGELDSAVGKKAPFPPWTEPRDYRQNRPMWHLAPITHV